MKRFVKSGLGGVLLAFILLFAATGCSSDPKVRSKKFLDNGDKLYAKNEFKQAALYYRRALREDATFADAYYKLGLTSIKLNNWSDAIGALQRAFTLNPNNSDAGAKLAEIYMIATAQDPKRAKQFAQEIRDVSDRLLKRDPKSFDGLRLAAFLDLAEGRAKEAIEKYQKANAAKPDQQEVTVPLAQALLNDKQFEAAESLGKEQIGRNKKAAPFYDLLYGLYMTQSKPQPAEEILKQKVANVGSPEAYLQMAAHYYGTQRRPEMEATIKQMTDRKDITETHLRAGEFYATLRENAKARQEFEAGLSKATEKSAKNTYIKRIIQLDVSERKLDTATQMVDKLLAEDPKDEEAKAMKSALEVGSGDLAKITKAVNDLSAMVRQNSDNPIFRYELARALMSQAAKENTRTDLIDRARVELEEAMRLRSDFALARLLLSQVYINRGDFSKGVQAAEEILSKQPGNVQALLMRGVAWRGLHEYEKAQATFQGLLKANPSLADARFHLGYTFFEQKKYKEAEATFDEMRRLNEGDGRWLTGLVQTYLALNRNRDAVTLLQGQVAKYPTNDSFQISLASVLISDKQFGKANEIYQTLLQKNPNSGDLHAMLGELHQRIWESNKAAGMGELKIAADYFRKAVKITPENPGLLIKLGMVLEDLELSQEARSLYETVLRLEPGNTIALNNLAFIKAEEGSDLDGALTMAQRAKQQQPGSLEISDTLGWIYIKKNLPDEALRIYQDLVKKRPDNPVFRMHMAQAMFQKGDRPGARQELNNALKYNPTRTVEQQIRGLLQKI
ncbi:lipoprotein [Bryobacterales bacterium F-183]|nr:lipoprotein [Bryobacterales bacterium F-183]